MSSEQPTSSGVQQLIDRLHQEGVDKGRAAAETRLAEARQEAAQLLDAARREADEIVRTAREEAERTLRSGEEAVRLAGRDAILKLTEELHEDFERKLRRLVGHQLQDRQVLRELILEIARRAVPADSEKRTKVVLLADSLFAEPVSNESQPKQIESLNEFVHSLGAEALRDGLTLEVDEDETPGVRVQIVDDDLEIDLTTETLTHLLLKQLSPRFRAIIQPQ